MAGGHTNAMQMKKRTHRNFECLKTLRVKALNPATYRGEADIAVKGQHSEEHDCH